jgi:hypothetical protein
MRHGVQGRGQRDTWHRSPNIHQGGEVAPNQLGPGVPSFVTVGWERYTTSSPLRNPCHTLRALKKPILIVMDDVDRLSIDEVMLLFQLVKASADFPNMVYLLLFQRDIVEKSLQDGAPTSAREFLEKIVQVWIRYSAH